MPGTLYVVATPIGNLEDVTARAARVLGEVDVIACEDTRQTSKLLQHLGLHKPLVSYHDHNEAARAVGLVARLQRGESVALVSDAGTPLIADPGYRLVREAVEAGVAVVPVPGPSAIMAALSASGLPTDRFTFAGFLSPKPGQRRRQLEELQAAPGTLILYEAPHRILEFLDDAEAVLGGRPLVLAREVSKLHEEFLRGDARGLREKLASRGMVRGEFTVLVGPGGRERIGPEEDLPTAVARLIAQGEARMDAIKAVARERGLSKREVYRLLEEAEPVPE